jgi:t-SNARE complex subunit (syntaxin)
MQDIHGIVTELNGIVKEQGSKLDLIETQVEDAKINVHVGTENIQTSDSWHSKFSFGLFNWF